MGFLPNFLMNPILRDEIALYDRQIRLWGVDAQKRIREGSVLIRALSVSGTVQEICKNLTLSGLSRIEISLKTSEISTDTNSNIFFNDFRTQMSEINSQLFLNIQIENEVSISKCHNFIIICGEFPIFELENINNVARLYGIPSTWCCYHGTTFYVLNDFINFTFRNDDKKEQTDIRFTPFSEVFRNIGCISTSKNGLLSQFSKVLENPEKDQSKLSCMERLFEIAGAAIVAAVVCQEVLKLYSRKDAPINNLFALDPKNLKNLITLI